MFYYFIVMFILMEYFDTAYSSERHSLASWKYINLHCRDNENKPVDWWYIYKPPLSANPNMELGRNFSYIVPKAAGRWTPSNRFVNSNSMLQHTLSPLYRPTYVNHLAVIAYSATNTASKESSAYGLLMADELGGVWIGHTVPGLIDTNADRPSFPSMELDNGHLMTCMSLDLQTLNLVAGLLKEVSPTVLRMRVPSGVRQSLPNWRYFNHSVPNLIPKPLEFHTTDRSLRAMLLVRRPGDTQCLYKTFAWSKRVILDVYGHDKLTPHGCEQSFGIRKIDSISIKYLENVSYIDNKTDKASFAVSTAAHWQTKGAGPRQYWTCTSTVEREDSTDKGGFILCVEHYAVWWSFDNMKIKEPKC